VKQFLEKLCCISDALDQKGLKKFADKIDSIISVSAKEPRLDSRIRQGINGKIHDMITGRFFESVSAAVEPMFSLLESNGIVALQEDGTKFSGIFTGAKGDAKIDLAPSNSKDDKGFYTPFTNSIFVLTWYKVADQKFEIVAYLS